MIQHTSVLSTHASTQVLRRVLTVATIASNLGTALTSPHLGFGQPAEILWQRRGGILLRSCHRLLCRDSILRGCNRLPRRDVVGFRRLFTGCHCSWALRSLGRLLLQDRLHAGLEVRAQPTRIQAPRCQLSFQVFLHSTKPCGIQIKQGVFTVFTPAAEVAGLSGACDS